MKKTYIDLHCHPTIKPFGQSFDDQLKHSSNFRKKNSIWFKDRPGFFERLLNQITSLTKFTQSDYRTLQKGNCKIISVSLYPLEKGFFDIPKFNLGTGEITDILLNFVLGVSDKRIDFVQSNINYFLDLENEYRFLLEQNNQAVKIKNKTYFYKIINGFDEIKADDPQHENTIYNIISIEGAHVFNCGYDPINAPATERADEVLEKVQQVKNWEYPPFFITLAHHFYNELCGHEKTFEGLVNTFIGENQKLGLGEGITPLGYKVIKALLNQESGKRILIDLKHMSIKARREYYALMDSEAFKNQHIPLIVSHGAVTGTKDETILASQNTLDTENKFLNKPINFYDFELIRLQKSGGIFGLQLDKRRIASEDLRKKTRKFRLRKDKIRFHWSALAWNQIQHIAEVLDQAGLPAWNLTVLGSDFDGIINPLTSFWNAETYPSLESNLIIHAKNYLKSSKLSKELNQITAEEVVYKVMYGNAAAFLEKNFNSTRN